MKNLLVVLFTIFSLSAFSQTPVIPKAEVKADLTVMSRNIWRGVTWGNSPILAPALYLTTKHHDVGVFTTVSLNGNYKGYGNWVELYYTYKLGKFEFTLDDYYFYSEFDKSNDYFQYNKSLTNHFLEGRVKLNTEKFDLSVGHSFYNQMGNEAFYIESEYMLSENTGFNLDYITGNSYLTGYSSNTFTRVGINHTRKINFTENYSVPLKTALIVNPGFKKIQDGLAGNPVNLLVTLTF